MFTFLKKPKWILLSLLLIAITAGIIYFFTRPKKSKFETIEVKRMDITQEVSVTGKIVAKDRVDLSFEGMGKITDVKVKTGDIVRKGDLLVRMDASELASMRDEVLALGNSQKKITDAAELNLSNAYENIPEISKDAYLKAYDGVRRETDLLFSDDDKSNPNLLFQTKNLTLKEMAENKRARSSVELKKWQDELESLDERNNQQSKTLLLSSEQHLTTIRDFLSTMLDSVYHAKTLSDTEKQTYKASLNTALASVNASITDIKQQTQSLDNLKVGYEKSLLDQKNIQAQIQTANRRLGKTHLYSPIDGMIIKNDFTEGEIADISSIIAVATKDQFEAEADVPEADVAKIEIGDTATISCDAFTSDTVFHAKVLSIDPAEKIIEGVPTYRMKLSFDTVNEKIRSGMTADILIITSEKKNVLSLPGRSIFKKDDEKFVRVFQTVDGKESVEDRKIATGLRGSDGDVEILHGLQEEEKVVTTMKD